MKIARFAYIQPLEFMKNSWGRVAVYSELCLLYYQFLIIARPSPPLRHPVTKTLTTLRIGKYGRYYTKGRMGAQWCCWPVPLYGSQVKKGLPLPTKLHCFLDGEQHHPAYRQIKLLRKGTQKAPFPLKSPFGLIVGSVSKDGIVERGKGE